VGYRLIRSSELERERAAAVAAVDNARFDTRGEIARLTRWCEKLDRDLEVSFATHDSAVFKAHAREVALLEQMADLQGKLQAALTHSDLVTVRVNVLEHENAQFRQLAKPDVKVIVPAVGKSPIGAAMFDGANADLFADVGDNEAERLRAIGMLHDQVPAEGLVPVGAAAIAPDGFKDE
jgi:hypothetical protein